MIQDFDEVLRQILEHELPAYNGGIEISFDQPTNEWETTKRDGPHSLNLFLHDIRENHILRRPDFDLNRQNGRATIQRAPARLDLHYMVTAWSNTAEDEHRLLSDFLNVFLRYSTLSMDKIEKLQQEKKVTLEIPESIRNQPEPIPMRLARHDEFNNPAEIWGVLDNELRPAISCVATVALNPYEVIESTPVRTRELRYNAGKTPLPHPVDEETLQKIDRLWMIGGTIHSEEPFRKVKLRLVERDLEVPVTLIGQKKKDEPVNKGRFKIGHLAAGNYTLEAMADERPPISRPITVPNDPKKSPDETYNIEI
jgi:hypothetical protein